MIKIIFFKYILNNQIILQVSFAMPMADIRLEEPDPHKGGLQISTAV